MNKLSISRYGFFWLLETPGTMCACVGDEMLVLHWFEELRTMNGVSY